MECGLNRAECSRFQNHDLPKQHTVHCCTLAPKPTHNPVLIACRLFFAIKEWTVRGPGIETYICCSSVNVPSSVALLQMRMVQVHKPKCLGRVYTEHFKLSSQPAGSALPT